MNSIDIAVIVIVCVAFLCVSGYLIYRKVKHKSGCSDCSSCSSSGGSCPHCTAKNDKD